jgi:hypothetical protein
MVHCMWGVHSSGIVAAMALMQFCDWPEARARDYWHQTRNHAHCAGGCDAWFDNKMQHFGVDPGLRIGSERQQGICPTY